MQRTENLKLVQELNSSIILKMIRHHVLISCSEIAKKNKIRLTTFLKEHENNSITVSKNVLCKLYKLTANTH